MKVDEVMLMAYVDQELAPHQRAQVEALAAASPEVAATLAAMQASRLPYAAAYGNQPAPRMPDALGQHVSALIGAATARHSDIGIGQNPVSPSDRSVGQAASRRKWMGFGLAAAFASGLAIRSLLERVANVGPAAIPAWVEAVANYQAMYVAATVDGPPQALANASKVVSEFLADVGGSAGSFAVPDLASAGFTFKRIQRLAFGATPLLQIAYLTTSGKPAALCALASVADGASAPIIVRSHGLALVTWQKGKLNYAFALDMPDAQAMEIARPVAQGTVGTLLRVVG
jgi:anti-sigma factor RsiW